jgi:hypothetical protein
VWGIVAHSSISMFHNTFILDPLHTKRMGHEPSARLDLNSDNIADIYAVCVNCNKRFTSIRAISMHLKVTAADFE